MYRFSPSLRGNDGQLSEFIDGLGPGQLVGRQVLGAPSLGDIQLSMCHQKGFLEVEVIRARGLQVKERVGLLKKVIKLIAFNSKSRRRKCCPLLMLKYIWFLVNVALTK